MIHGEKEILPGIFRATLTFLATHFISMATASFIYTTIYWIKYEYSYTELVLLLIIYLWMLSLTNALISSSSSYRNASQTFLFIYTCKYISFSWLHQQPFPSTRSFPTTFSQQTDLSYPVYYYYTKTLCYCLQLVSPLPWTFVPDKLLHVISCQNSVTEW